MSETEPNPKQDPPKKQALWRRVSSVWLLPLVAVLIGASLLLRSLEQLGPTVTIRVSAAGGLSADETTIKYRDMDIGTVTDIEFGDDLASVIVRARLHQAARPYLTKSASFWVARPRVTLAGITDLDTLVSGHYLAFQPGHTEDAPVDDFTALEVPPIVVAQGSRFVLEAKSLGRLDVGDPVYYRGERVGTVTAHELHPDANSVGIGVSIAKPYVPLIRTNTVFWNASGIHASLGWKGFDVQTVSLESLLIGGIAFATPDEPGKNARAGSVFELHPEVKDDWLDWSPKIPLGKISTGQSMMEEPVAIVERTDTSLFHHKGDEAGSPDDELFRKHWFGGLTDRVLEFARWE